MDQLCDGDFVDMTPNTQDLLHSDQGTAQAPWGSENDLIFQGAVGMNVVAEFYSNPRTGDVGPVSKVHLYPYRPDQPVPTGADGSWPV